MPDGYFRGVPIGLAGGAVDDGVVALPPGIARLVTPFSASADGDERLDVDEAVFKRVVRPEGKVEPVDALFDRPDSGTLAEEGESPDDSPTADETSRPAALRHLRDLSTQPQGI